MVWTIEPLALHRVLVPGPEVLFQRAFTEMVTLVIYAFVLRQAGQVCLVDTGLAPEHSELNRAIRLRKGAQSGFEAMADPLPTLLHARSLRPDCVLLTSFGPYTTGHLAAFDGATLVVSARGCADLLQPEEPALVHAPAPMARDRLLAGQRVHGSQEILPGLHFHEVGVHHPASAAVLVDTAQGRIGISDPVFTARNLLEGLALGAAEQASHWHAHVRMLGTLCDAVLPIHDPDPRPVARARWHASLAAQ
jgi:hypothetical protein